MKFFALTLFVLISFPVFADTPAPEESSFPDPNLFPLPGAYKPNVDFWIRVYGEWEENKLVIHDSENLQIIFDVIEIPEENNLLRAAARANVTRRLMEIKRILIELHENPGALERSGEHKKIFELYRDIYDPQKFRKAAENLRVQQGIKERFERGLERMTQYIDRIKEIFRQEGVPEDLAYLPLVESSFNNESLSRTRAAGIWQFMPATARYYMKVNSDVDERLDPFVASRAAARYLKRSYNMYGSWPLALTSYNHGQAGILKAIRTLGTTDFMTIYYQYKGNFFGFASRNFYAEFLAAYYVMKNAEKYFENLEHENPLVHDSIHLSRPLSMALLLKNSPFTREEIRLYNPALKSTVIFGKRPIPAGYELRMPAGKVGDLVQFIAQVRSGKPPEELTVASGKKIKPPVMASVAKTYVVRKGDTLFGISRKFSTTVEMLRRLNRLTHNRIFPGQRLLIHHP